MKTILSKRVGRSFMLSSIALSLALCSIPASARAQDSITAADITSQELELKTKQIELEKAKLEVQKTESLELQKAKLELEIKTLELAKAKRDLQVKETQDRLDMALQGDVLFDTAKATIKPSAVATLKQVAMLLQEYPKGKVTVTGFADSTGSEDVNLQLSRERAESVKTYLLDKSGVSSERVVAKGMGEEKPAASNMNAAGRQLNRRVEISVSKVIVD